jgi:hypothetical protein
MIWGNQELVLSWCQVSGPANVPKDWNKHLDYFGINLKDINQTKVNSICDKMQKKTG